MVASYSEILRSTVSNLTFQKIFGVSLPCPHPHLQKVRKVLRQILNQRTAPDRGTRVFLAPKIVEMSTSRSIHKDSMNFNINQGIATFIGCGSHPVV